VRSALHFDKAAHSAAAQSDYSRYARHAGEILVENLSPAGLRFKTIFPHDIAAHETLWIKFALEDEHRTTISEQIQVSYVRGYQMGARLLTTNSDKAALHAYLLG
jgi:hypothetical protein